MRNDDDSDWWPNERRYSIGRGKPPKHTQFKKGKSGNPLGRPKKEEKASSSSLVDRSARDEDLAFMEQLVSVQKGGKVERISMRDAIRQKQAALAMSGNPLALKHILERDERNRKELAAEIAEDHRWWREYIVKYERLDADAQKRGEAMPTHLSHPEDLVFREGRFVYNKYGLRPSDVEAQLLTFVRLRELCFLQAEWEQRQCPDDRPVSVVQLLPMLINN